MTITQEFLDALMPKAAAAGRTRAWFPVLTEAMAHFDINTPDREDMFLANVAEETGELMSVPSEDLHYSANRMIEVWPSLFAGNETLAQELAHQGPEAIANYVYDSRRRGWGGNTNDGDGWKYRGRGLYQLTWKANYQAYFKAIGLPPDSDPDLLLQPEHAAMSAAWFIKQSGSNELADRGDFREYVRTGNGGYGNYDTRLMYFNRARSLRGGDNAPVPRAKLNGIIRVGDHGEDVRVLQKALNEQNADMLDEDGVFGSTTLLAVRRFQSMNGLLVDGVAGRQTLTALGIWEGA